MKRLLVWLVCTLAPAAAFAQQPAVPTTIPEMWTAWCARCHAVDGSGKVAEPTITIEPMDFTNCKLNSSEGDPDWERVIALGGPSAGLSSVMPAFGDVLSKAQISEFVAFMRKLCKEPGWPSGNLNMPRPVFAEKAFLEDEFILAPVVSHRKGEPAEVALKAVYERRIGKRAQFELVLPIESLRPVSSRETGISDAEIGFKFALNPTTSNHLVTAGFDFVAPTGDESRGLGGGAVFEPYLSTATAIGAQNYLQTQIKLEFPRTRPKEDMVTVYNIYLGRDLRLEPMAWTLGLELNGENRDVALTPQVRKGLVKTGALAGAFGVRLPINNRREQGVKWIAYLLWEYLEPVRTAR
jgi:hypothetical protein